MEELENFRRNTYNYENQNFLLCTDFDIDKKFKHDSSNKQFPFHQVLLKFLYKNPTSKIYLTDILLKDKGFEKKGNGVFLINIDEFESFCLKLYKREGMLSAFLKQEVDLSNITISDEGKTNILSNTNENDLINIFEGFSVEKRDIFLNLLKNISDIDFQIKNNEDSSEEELLEILKEKDLSFLKSIITNENITNFLNDDYGEAIIESFLENNITKNDIINIGYRKEQLNIFDKLLNLEGYKSEYKKEIGKENTKDETMWQYFFNKNDWIFGYGLDYKYLGILQKEAHISNVQVDGTNEVISDFLLGCNNFTVIVELKKDNTPLFNSTQSGQNRAMSWKISTDLMLSVSQILEQKASWELKSEQTNYDNNEEIIKQKTINPKCFLLIGRIDDLGENRTDNIKRRTFELFRRNLNNIEILTYDELYNRAKFLLKLKD